MALFVDLAETSGQHDIRVEHKLVSVGGASLRTHWNAGRAASLIKSGSYDYVV